MKVFWLVTGLLSLVFSIHLVLWRMRKPKRETLALLYLFFGFFLVGMALACAFSVLESPWDYLRAAIFFTASALAYISFHTALEVDSPTVVMVLKIEAAGARGLEADVLRSALTDEILVKPRIRDLLRDGYAISNGDRLQLTQKGLRFIRAMNVFHHLMGAHRR